MKKLLLILMLFVIAAPAIAQTTTEELIRNLDADEFYVRDAATDELSRRIKVDRTVFQGVTSRLDKAVSLEQKIRLRAIHRSFYASLDDIKAPIWSMPDEKRFVDDRDIAQEYFAQARLRLQKEHEANLYNNNKVMMLASVIYIKDRLESFDEREMLEKEIRQMNDNWIEETTLFNKMMRSYLITEKDNWLYFGGYVYHQEPPLSWEIRRAYKSKLDITFKDVKLVVPADRYIYHGSGDYSSD